MAAPTLLSGKPKEKTERIPILEYKDVIPLPEDFCDRKKLPPMLTHFILPMYLRKRQCALVDEDENNAGMEALLRKFYHVDYNTVMSMPFENAFVLMWPDPFALDENDTRNLVLPQFILHPHKLSLEPGQEPPKQSSKQQAKEKLIVETFERLIQQRMFCHHDIRSIAALIIVVYCYYSFEEDQLTNLRRAVYFANLILLAEGEVPIPAEAQSDELFALAIAQDCQRWVARRTPCVEMTTAFIKTLVRKCDVCGGLRSKDGVENLPAVACSRCRHGYYCGPQCQRDAFPAHKPFCLENKAAFVAHQNRARPAAPAAPAPITSNETVAKSE